MASGPAIGGGGGRKVSASQTVGVLNLLTDLAFNLLIFFVVCASTEPEQGRPQQVPSASQDKANDPKTQNVEVTMTRTKASVNGAEMKDDAEMAAKLKEQASGCR